MKNSTRCPDARCAHSTFCGVRCNRTSHGDAGAQALPGADTVWAICAGCREREQGGNFIPFLDMTSPSRLNPGNLSPASRQPEGLGEGLEAQALRGPTLHPKGAGPNWKVADLIPQPTAPVSEVVRAALAHLPDAYHLEEE